MVDFDDERYIPPCLEWDCSLQKEMSIVEVFHALELMRKSELYENNIDYESISYEYEFLQKI